MTLSYALPQQIYEWSGKNGKKLENIRRSLLDLLFEHHFQYVHPPIIEYQQILSLGSGKSSQDRAFRFADPNSGKMLAVRTDISPQISRMDYAINGGSEHVAKYCYAGEIALAKVDSLAIRNPYQVGAEIFGDSSVEADIEAIQVAIECCQATHKQDLLIDLGHTGILKKAIEKMAFSNAQQEEFMSLLQYKSQADSLDFIKKYDLNEQQQSLVNFLLRYSQLSMSQIAKQCDDLGNTLEQLLPECAQKWQKLLQIITAVKHKFPNLKTHIDLAELRGYTYHTGIVFGLYFQQKLLCRGGRYNHDSSSNFRTATGFTLDIHRLIDDKL